MALLLADGSQFVHIPKTGGSWVSEVLHDAGMVSDYLVHKHADYDRALFVSESGYRNRLWDIPAAHQAGLPYGTRKQLARWIVRLATNRLRARLTAPSTRPSPFRFAFVRHPLSWYESMWKFSIGQEWSDWGSVNSARDWHPCSVLNGLGDPDFNQFVRNVVAARPGYVSELYFAFAKRGIDYIGKTETLRDDLAEVARIRSWTVDPAVFAGKRPVNVSKQCVSKPIWDPDLRDLVTRLEMPALVHFDYLTPEECDRFAIPAGIGIHSALRQNAGPPVPKRGDGHGRAAA